MTSMLAQQLQALGKPGNSLLRGKGRPSLLFEAHQAADIDLQTIYDIALQGLVELCQADDNLKPFLNTLFRRDRVGLEREHQSKAVNEKVDQSLSALLTLLSRHFLKDATTKVLEFLIRQYRVNEFNVSALMGCALPFHSTLQFVRLVQTMRLESLWTFLAPMQQSGAPLPRSTLVQRCCNDAALLEFVCQAAQQAASPSWLSFYGVVVCEVLAAVPKVTEDAIARLLPFILNGLKATCPKEQRMATYMIIMQLISRSTPAPQLFNVLGVEIAKGAKEGPVGPALLLLTGLLKSQAGHATLPPKTLKRKLLMMQHIKRLPKLLEELAAKPKQMAPLLKSLLSSLIAAEDSAEAHQKLLQDIIAEVPMAEHAEAAATKLLHAFQTANKEALPGMQQTMRALDIRYPNQVDAAVNKALAPLGKGRKKNKKKGDDAAEGDDGDDEVVKAARRVLDFVTGALDKRSARKPLPDASATLAHAVDAPSAELRRTAVMQLEKTADGEGNAGDDWAVDVLLRRLADDDAGVVLAVLDSPLLMSIPAAALFDGLSASLQRATAALRSAAADSSGPMGIAKKVLKLLAGPFLRQHAAYQQRVLVLLLDNVLLLPMQRKLALVALKALKKQDFPPLAGLESVEVDSVGEKSPSSKESVTKALEKPSDDLPTNRSIIAAIAKGVQDSSHVEDIVTMATAGHANAQHVLLLALCHACSQAAEPGTPAAAPLLNVLLADSAALSGDNTAKVIDMSAHFTDDGLPSNEHFSVLASAPQDTQRALRRHALLVALQHAGPEVLEQWAGGPHALFQRIAGLSPPQAYDVHLSALVQAVSGQGSPAVFLSDIFGVHGDDGTASADMQVRALDLLGSRFAAPRKPHKAADATAAFHSVLPRLLGAIGSAHRSVRAAALAALPPAASSLSGSHAHGILAQPHLAELVAAVTQQREVLETDPLALASLLRDALRHAQQNGGGSAVKSPKRGKASAAAKNGSSLGLSSAAATAVGEYFLAILPEQHGEAGASAALLLLQCIAPSAEASAGLHAGSLLLSRYLATDAWKVNGAALRLVRELLDLYTAEALAGVTEHPKRTPKSADSPFEVLLKVITLRPADTGAEPSATAVKQRALVQLSAALYAAVPADSQVQLLLAMLHASSSDSDEACRAAAHRALADAPVSAASLVDILSMEPSAPPRTPAKKARAETAAGRTSSLDDCVAVLELLQWKANVQNGVQLVGSLSSLLPYLLAIAREAAPATTVGEEETSSRPVAAAYALQLALSALQLVAARHAHEGAADSVDLELVLQCAREAPGSMARTAALTLLAQLASVLPRFTLEHVLEVVIAQASTSEQEADAVSAEASARVLQAFAAAWVAAGHEEAELTQLVVKASARVPAQLRLPLLSALSTPMSSASSLQSMCTALLELAVQAPKGSGEEASSEEDLWLSTAATLSSKAPWVTRLQALQGTLEECVQEDRAAGLQAAALRFIADQLAALVESSGGAMEPDVRQALVQLMQTATDRMQQISKGEAEDTMTALLDALEHAMPAADYLKGLVSLTQHDSQPLRRRALRLFTSRMNSLQAVEDDDQPGLEAASAAASTAAEAASAVAEQLPRLLAADQSAGVRQTALLALSSVASACGKERPDLVLAALPSALAATRDAQRPVRSSALATVAACTAALGTHALPQLVPLVTSVLLAVEAAGTALAAADDAQPAPKAKARNANEERRRSGASAEALHVETASALAALDALAAGMGAFLAPYLPRVLELVLQRSLLACRAPAVAATAAHAWRVLADAVPPRLLLPPLFGHLNNALQGGAAPARALLQMVERAVAAMQPATAAAHADALFGFLQQALDVRQREGMPSADATAVERAATATLVAATMKLSEKQFKPLFLRLLTWASTPPAGQPDVQPLGRQVVLYGVIHALTERLRSVFVPYFRYVLDGAVTVLTGQAQEASQPKKKRRKSKAIEPVGDVVSADAGVAQNTWLLRFRVLQSLRACFQYDSVQFVDEDRFRHILPALVAQLGAFPSEDALLLLAGEEGNASSVAPGSGADATAGWRAQDSVFGRAAVDALVELGASCGSDALWTPFNHQVWNATRSEDAIERSRAVAVMLAMLERMREEYAQRIAEAQQHIHELKEHSEPLLAAQLRQLTTLFNEITGEDLDEFT